MGVSFICSSSSNDRDYRSPTPTPTPNIVGNPDPKNFEIGEYQYVGDFLIVRVKYPDSKNFEGDKILVFYRVSISELRLLEALDPHFSGSALQISPIARFRPTLSGWMHAINLYTLLNAAK